MSTCTCNSLHTLHRVKILQNCYFELSSCHICPTTKKHTSDLALLSILLLQLRIIAVILRIPVNSHHRNQCIKHNTHTHTHTESIHTHACLHRSHMWMWTCTHSTRAYTSYMYMYSTSHVHCRSVIIKAMASCCLSPAWRRRPLSS